MAVIYNIIAAYNFWIQIVWLFIAAYSMSIVTTDMMERVSQSQWLSIDWPWRRSDLRHVAPRVTVSRSCYTISWFVYYSYYLNLYTVFNCRVQVVSSYVPLCSSVAVLVRLVVSDQVDLQPRSIYVRRTTDKLAFMDTYIAYFVWGTVNGPFRLHIIQCAQRWL